MVIYSRFGCWVSFATTPCPTPSLPARQGISGFRLLILSHGFDFVSFLYLPDIKSVTRPLSMLGVVGVEGVGCLVCLATIIICAYARWVNIILLGCLKD